MEVAAAAAAAAAVAAVVVVEKRHVLDINVLSTAEFHLSWTLWK